MKFEDDKNLERIGAWDGKSCPHCKTDLLVRRVEKTERNKGRLFVTCGPCEFFAWLDVPCCKTCGMNKIEYRVKKDSPNKGRRFHSCPNQCRGSFRWVDEPAATDCSD